MWCKTYFTVPATSRALAEEPPLTLADVEVMSDAECREHLTLMLKVLKAEAPTLIWLRRAALHTVGGDPGNRPPAEETSNTVADMPGMKIFRILKTPQSIDRSP